MDTTCLRVGDICDSLKISPSTLHRWVRENRFPRPMKIERVLMWRESAVAEWLESKEGKGDE